MKDHYYYDKSIFIIDGFTGYDKSLHTFDAAP